MYIATVMVIVLVSNDCLFEHFISRVSNIKSQTCQRTEAVSLAMSSFEMITEITSY